MKDKIGKFKPKNRFFLAPMLEPNDIAFRLLCKKAGCGLTYTGMINPLSKQKLILDDKPAIQIFCTKPKGIKEFIKKHEKKAVLFDFNLGCPSTLAEKMGFGSFLHEDIDAIEKILQVMRESTKKPITIKLRKSPKTYKIAKMAEKYVDAIGIHPRTQKQGYSGEPDFEFAMRLKSESCLPIIYSGNVNESNIKKLLENFDFVMIGREAIGKPNIFSKLIGKKEKIKFKDYLKLAKKYKLFFRQIKYQAINFTKGMENAKSIRDKLSRTTNVKEIKETMKKVD
jgi:tRNA-dihydrouridine synthase B